MKKTYKILIGALSACSIMVSCNKLVDYNPHDDYHVTALDYLKTESDYRTMEVSVYTPIQWLNQMVPIGDIASDNAVAGGESASDIIDLQQIDNFTVNPVNSTLEDLWSSAFEGVNRANYMIQYKDANPQGTAVNFTGKDALYGEIYFLRAYYYFSLVRMFGGVPVFVDRRLSITDSRTLQRATKEEVYAQIEIDLENAIFVLPTTQAQKGRVTKYAAQALLGKVYVYESKFDKAAAVLDSVINSGAFSLVPSLYNVFLSTGENGSESVFEIQYSNLSPYYNWSGQTKGQGNYAVQQCGVRGISGTADMPYAAGWSSNLPTQDLANAYTTGDTRKDATILDMEAYKNANPQLNVTYQVAPYKNTGLYNQKYQPRKGQSSGQIELNYLNNYRTIRYAEVLLLAAEAYNRSTAANDSKAQGYLNQVRQRAFGDNNHNITSSGSTLTQAIWNERRLELAMEGDRYFDLVRTNQAAAKITGFVTGKNEVFPIPQDEVTISGITQNPNY